MKKAKIIISILFLITTSVSLGLGTYFVVSYFRRNENKKFEAAYIYDTTFSTSIDADLGQITPGETKDMDIPIVSLMNRKVDVEISFRGDENNFNNYIDVAFDDYTNHNTVGEYIRSDLKYTFTLDREESRNVQIHYSLNSEDAKGDTNFVVFIKAKDFAPLTIETKE